MTIRGATEAVTPEHLIRKFDEGWEVFLSSQLGDLSKQIALAELAEAIRQYGREAEANALRRALYEVEYIERYEASDRDVLLKYIATRIRSLLPKEEGK